MANSSNSWSARIPVYVGFTSILVMLLSIGYWSVGVQLSGAVVASGLLKVENESQVVQHVSQGVVSEVLVVDGDTVEAGDTLVRLDSTFKFAEALLIERQLLENRARVARLEAERDGTSVLKPRLDFPFFDFDQTWFDLQVEGQQELLNARRTSIETEIEQLEEQAKLLDLRVTGIEAQIEASRAQSVSLTEELKQLSALFEDGLIAEDRVIQLKRNLTNTIGEIGKLEAEVAETLGEKTGIRIEKLTRESEQREQAITELRELAYRNIELEQKHLTLREEIDRMNIKAPISGTVFGNTVFAEETVISAGAPLMYLVPAHRPLVVSVRISTVDVDQVYLGQDVQLKFSAFSEDVFPDLQGKVVRISADAIVSETEAPSGAPSSYYMVNISPDLSGLSDSPNVEILPGMPVEAYIQTEFRTPLNYFTKPLAVYFNRAFRET